MDAPQELDSIEVTASRPDPTQEMRDIESQNLRQATDVMGQLDPNSISASADAFMSRLPQATPDMQQAPQDHLGEIMKSAPIFMGLAALGGKVFRSHGLAMLGATNAMMKGYASGSEQEYKNAMIDYQKKWKELAQKQQTYIDVWRSIYEARKGQFDAHIKASDTANKIIGETDRNAIATEKLIQTQELALQKGELESQRIQATLDRIEQQSKFSADKAQLERDKFEWSKTHPTAGKSAGSAKSAEAKQKVDAAIATLEDLKSMVTKNTTGGKGMLNRAAESTKGFMGSNSPQPANDFESTMTLAQKAVSVALKARQITNKDAVTMQTILRGLKVGDNPVNTQKSIDRVIQFLKREQGEDTSFGETVLRFDSQGNPIP